LKGLWDNIQKKSWRKFQTDKNKHLVNDEAIDLLDKCLLYDHQARITCKEALAHPYFDPVRPGSTKTKSSDEDSKDKKEKEKEKEKQQQQQQQQQRKKNDDDDTDETDESESEEEGAEKPKLKIPFQGKSRG